MSESPGAPRRDVVVVGGGFAGVTAARDLTKRGYDCVLLEARDRLGGRTWTTEIQGYDLELGGTWIHWSQPFVWTEAQRYGLAVVEVPGSVPDRVVLWLDGEPREIDEPAFGEFLEGFERFFAETGAVWERPWDSHFQRDEIGRRDAVSVAARIDSLGLTRLQHNAVTAFLETLTLSPLDEASYVEVMRVYALAGGNYPAFSDSLTRYKLADGTAALIRAMARDGGFETRLDTPVRAIHHDQDGATVETASGESVSARAVVMTVPLNVLHEVDFRPAISAVKLEASRRRHAGRGFKIFFEVEGNPGNVMTLARGADHPLGACFTFLQGNDLQGNERSLLVGFGIDEQRLEDDLDTWQAALERLLPGIRVTRKFGHPWCADPWAAGTWCSLKAGTFERYADELTRREGRLFFASGDHGEGWRGFIDGAIGSASRVASSVAQLLG